MKTLIVGAGALGGIMEHVFWQQALLSIEDISETTV